MARPAGVGRGTEKPRSLEQEVQQEKGHASDKATRRQGDKATVCTIPGAASLGRFSVEEVCDCRGTISGSAHVFSEDDMKP